MIKRVAFIFGVMLLALHTFQASAQELPQAARIGPNQILRGRFEQQRHLTGFSAPVKSYGVFVLQPGRGLIWKTERPFAITTVLSPAGLVQEVKGRETVRMASAQLPFMAKLYAMLSGVLTGDWTMMSNAFTITQAKEGKSWRLKLTPLRANDPSMPIKEINAAGSRLLEDVEVIKPNGDKDRLIFSAQKLETGTVTEDEAALFNTLGR